MVMEGAGNSAPQPHSLHAVGLRIGLHAAGKASIHIPKGHIGALGTP